MQDVSQARFAYIFISDSICSPPCDSSSIARRVESGGGRSSELAEIATRSHAAA